MTNLRPRTILMPVIESGAKRDNENAVPAGATSILRNLRQRPKLLVSVRSVGEANRALEGGVDILDVKDPSRGSLGMASINDITAIASLGPVSSRTILLSVALGEVVDWNSSQIDLALPSDITFAKLGLSQCAQKADWKAEWLSVRKAVQRQSSSKLNWVAVAYADLAEANSPSVADVLAAAIETDCVGLLIDTWTKDGRTLLDGLDDKSITTIANDCHKAGLFLAVAGKLSHQSLQRLASVPVDVVAIRSAACVGTDRTLELDPRRVTDFQTEMRRCFVL